MLKKTTTLFFSYCPLPAALLFTLNLIIHFSLVLSRPSSQTSQSALIGQRSQRWAGPHLLCFRFSLCWVYDCGDCIVVTSHPYISPFDSFEGTVSECGLCAFVHALRVLRLYLLYIEKGHWNITFCSREPLRYVQNVKYIFIRLSKSC